MGALNKALGHPRALVIFAITYSILIPYVFLALKRVYHEQWGRTLAKSLALLLAAFVSDIPINIAARYLAIALT